jgi:hypothetical protein
MPEIMRESPWKAWILRRKEWLVGACLEKFASGNRKSP